MSFTGKLTVSNTAVNLMALLVAAGYTGNSAARVARLFNPSSTVALYVMDTATGTAAPGTPTDGWPVGTGAAHAGGVYSLNDDQHNGLVDLGLIWLYAASSISINVTVKGA
jgi:hypothetical protein